MQRTTRTTPPPRNQPRLPGARLPAAQQAIPRRGDESSDAYRQLREAIIDGRFHPNERLVEAELVERFGAGRSSIRAALVRLDQEGLVSRQPNRGARVRLITDREAVEIEQVRIALEKMLARTAAERVTGADLEELAVTVTEMQRRVANGDPLGYSALNSRFHRRIWAIADHALAASMLTTLKSQSIRFQYRTILQPGRAETSLREHVAILQALEQRDPDAAEAAMAEHLSHVVGTLRRAITAQADRSADLAASVPLP